MENVVLAPGATGLTGGVVTLNSAAFGPDRLTAGAFVR